ncbi:MAG: hypothetical protein JGK03_01080 [Microcoleus sp. PH2017_25_DOB_D_A]|uniref:hypothetical protein n=2 Tax=unclassified Microcoleus TaxID=2642155 RepID=UPI001DB84C9B|nr:MULTISPECIES: hypothetical protein [unclassified Microcoleus]MCC3410695.1 hypothetical protein [Microcoleus sp. PH2017_02_FOX_O_A]MCC3489125.1 hypothetical protein [Microcoleus sp. PH2017_16_JOR_D_A]MCC3532810.1 hypothetical protein [Microcoleus sp. PH2017_25_DOB_D_A]
MKRNTLSFLIVTLFTVTTGMAAQVNAASQPVQKQNLASVQAQSNASQTVPIKLLTQAQIVMKGGDKRDGQVVKIDQKVQKLWIQASGQQRSIPLNQIDKIMFPKSTPPPISNRGLVMRSGKFKWNGIPMNAFELKDAAKGQAVVKLGPPVVNREQLQYILEIQKDRQIVVDEIRFNVQKKTMTILATPIRRT